MSEIKLKPCPFCGGEAEIMIDWQPWSGNPSRFFVACLVCGAETPRNSRTKGEAIQAWDRRVDNEET